MQARRARHCIAASRTAADVPLNLQRTLRQFTWQIYQPHPHQRIKLSCIHSNNITVRPTIISTANFSGKLFLKCLLEILVVCVFTWGFVKFFIHTSGDVCVCMVMVNLFCTHDICTVATCTCMLRNQYTVSRRLWACSWLHMYIHVCICSRQAY